MDSRKGEENTGIAVLCLYAGMWPVAGNGIRGVQQTSVLHFFERVPHAAGQALAGTQVEATGVCCA